MSSINCNVDKLKVLATDFDKLLQDYKLSIENIFETISSISDKAWSGEDAKLYISSRLKDKVMYDELTTSLEKYSSKLHNASNNLENAIDGVDNLNE